MDGQKPRTKWPFLISSFLVITMISGCALDKRVRSTVDTTQKNSTKHGDIKKQPIELNQSTRGAHSAKATMYEAVLTGDTKKIRALLLVNPALANAELKDDDTPLCLAAEEGQQTVAELLLENGADPRIATRSGITPLHFAALEFRLSQVEPIYRELTTLLDGRTNDNMPVNGEESQEKLLEIMSDYRRRLVNSTPRNAVLNKMEIIELLLKSGANVNARDPLVGFSPLHYAALNPQFHLAELLVTAGAEVNLESHDGITPLHMAATLGVPGVVEALIRNGANVDAKNRLGGTPLFPTAAFGQLGNVKKLIENHADINARNQLDATPLIQAISYGQQEIVQLLLINGARVNSPDAKGWTPLNYAAFGGSEQIVKLLLARGANFRIKDKHGYAPIATAAEHGHKSVVAVLLAAGADVETKTNDEHTPLTLAIRTGYRELVKLLLERGANVNQMTKDGFTALHGAAWIGRPTLAALLMAHGAKANRRGKKWGTPLHIVALGRKAFYEYLRSAKAAGNYIPQIKVGTSTEYLKTAEILLASGADVNARDASGATPLHTAAYNGVEPLARLFVVMGADLHARTNEGFTPLQLAKSRGHVFLAGFLQAAM